MGVQMHRNRQVLTWLLIFILVGLVFFVGRHLSNKKTICTKQEQTKAAIAQVCGAIDLFKLEQHRLPVQLKDLVECPPYIESTRWPSGGYLHQLPKDAWDRDLIYRAPGSKGRRFDVVSLGADGKVGGEDQDLDLEIDWPDR